MIMQAGCQQAAAVSLKYGPKVAITNSATAVIMSGLESIFNNSVVLALTTGKGCNFPNYKIINDMRHPTAIRSLLGLVLIYLCTKLSGVLGIVDSLGNILEPDSVVIVGIDVNSTDQPSTYRHIWNSSYGMKYCRELPDNGNKMWLMGELGEAGGLCNQLFGVFSYAPVALLYNASLIVGDMLTRLTFNRVYQASNFVRVPFSEFFNFEHFATYWQKNRGLIVVDKNDYNNCLDKIKKNGTDHISSKINNEVVFFGS